MLQVRAAVPAFHPTAPQQILDLDPRVFAIRRQTADGSSAVLCLHNCSADEVEIPGTAGENLLGDPIEQKGGKIRLQPYQVVWIREISRQDSTH